MNYNIEKIKISEELALFLGMFVGDGGLSIKYNGAGYRIYPITFYNTNKEIVELFHSLFYKLFRINGNIRCRKRKNKMPLWEFEKYSVKIYNKINKDLEIASGKKSLNVRIPSFILKSNKNIQLNFFLGLLITDGSIQKNKIQFHSGSKELIFDLSRLIKNIWGLKKEVKKYIQNHKYISYQISLNKENCSIIKQDMPRSHNPVLRRFLNQNFEQGA